MKSKLNRIKMLIQKLKTDCENLQRKGELTESGENELVKRIRKIFKDQHAISPKKE